MILRDYQREILNKVIGADSNDLVQLDTGAGKTPVEAALCEKSKFSLFIAHRNILIAQASEKLAAFGLEHDTISSEFTRRQCMLKHRSLGRNYIKRGHKSCIVASVCSIVSHYKRGKLAIDRNLPWVIVIDEAHHVLPDNQWGKLKEIFPNCRFVGFTATPARMDGESLSVSNGGIFDRLVQAEKFKEDSIVKLIENGSLCGFSVYSPEKTLNKRCRKKVLETSDDPVSVYKRLLKDKRAIVMCPAIVNAEEIALAYKDAEVPAACIHSGMSSSEVARIIALFVSSQIKVLCNVDMVGEGFDVPGVEGLIMIRRTRSFIAYKQWIGRALRPIQGKESAVIVDLVGNVAEHGLPDESVIWDLDEPPKVPKTQKKAPCKSCGFWYKVKLSNCPECNEPNALLERESIGDYYTNIKRLDVAMIREARREIDEQAREEIRRTQIRIPTGSFLSKGSLGKVAEKLRCQFVDGLKIASVTIPEINQFLEKSNNIDFWISNFKAADALNLNQSKIEKVYKKWLKSNSSAATR